MKGRITKTAVDKLDPGTELHDTEIVGFIARRLPSGKVSYALRYRTKGGKRSLYSIGLHGNITADQARGLAKQRAGEVEGGADPAADRVAARIKVATDQTRLVNAVLDNFVKRHVEGVERAVKAADAEPYMDALPVKRVGLGKTSQQQIKSAFDRLVRPSIGDKLIYDVKRSDIVDILDEIEDENGPTQADRTLAYLRKAFNWQMARDDTFVSPIIKGMNRVNPSERKRRRILTDEEIRDVWLAADRAVMSNENPSPRCVQTFIRLLLLTAQRRTQVARWHSNQMSIDGRHWIVEAADTKNGETHLVPVTPAIDAELPLRKGFLISTDGGAKAFTAFSDAKTAIDAEIAKMREAEGRKPMPHWVFHDIRRTGRSLMSRYATPDHAERVIGHIIPGVRGVYDHYDYADEKHAALEALARHVLGVVHPDSSKIVPLRNYAGEHLPAAAAG